MDGLKILSEFHLANGIPFAKFTINNMFAIFVLDTGCGESMIDVSALSQLAPDSIIAESSTQYVGIELKPQSSIRKINLDLKLNDLSFNQTFNIMDISKMFSTYKCDSPNTIIAGLIGGDFFIQNKVVIDYDKNQFYIFD